MAVSNLLTLASPVKSERQLTGRRCWVMTEKWERLVSAAPNNSKMAPRSIFEVISTRWGLPYSFLSPGYTHIKTVYNQSENSTLNCPSDWKPSYLPLPLKIQTSDFKTVPK